MSSSTGFLQRSLKSNVVSPIDAKLADRLLFTISNLQGNGKSVSGISTFETVRHPGLGVWEGAVRGRGRQERRGGDGGCTTKLENAHSIEFRELLYPWHPWSGLWVGVHEAVERRGDIVFRCDLKASDSERWLEIPAWMFDRSACAKVRLEADPHISLAALAALLRNVLNKNSPASEAVASGVSPLSGDRNRRESHAKPEQTEVGTPQRAAANRPVRRERAGDRRRANVVPTTDGDTPR
jgi:hypothetical protein